MKKLQYFIGKENAKSDILSYNLGKVPNNIIDYYIHNLKLSSIFKELKTKNRRKIKDIEILIKNYYITVRLFRKYFEDINISDIEYIDFTGWIEFEVINIYNKLSNITHLITSDNKSEKLWKDLNNLTDEVNLLFA